MDSIAAARASGAVMLSSGVEYDPLLDMNKESESLLAYATYIPP
jgi:hypothetical protein